MTKRLGDLTVGALVQLARGIRLDNLGDDTFDQVAELALALAQDRVRRLGGVLTPALTRSYRECGETERAGLRQGVEDVTKALVLLGWIELPGA